VEANEEKDVILSGTDSHKAPGKAFFHTWTAQEAQQRGVKAWVACWLAAIPSLFLPIAHFFLVPGFLILGPIMFIYFKKMTTKILEIRGPCPYCQQIFTTKNQPNQWPMDACCDACRRTFSITLN
jgi:hypothetical protein